MFEESTFWPSTLCSRLLTFVIHPLGHTAKTIASPVKMPAPMSIVVSLNRCRAISRRMAYAPEYSTSCRPDRDKGKYESTHNRQDVAGVICCRCCSTSCVRAAGLNFGSVGSVYQVNPLMMVNRMATMRLAAIAP